MNSKSNQTKPPLLEVRDLCLNFRNQKTGGIRATEKVAIEHVSFNIAAGRILGLVGASGAGKSSIARAIMHLIRPDSGEIRYNGTAINQMDSQQLTAVRRRVQMVFQDPSASLSPRRTVAQTIMEPLRHFDIGNQEHQNRIITETLRTVGLDRDVLERYPHQFSSGQQQRIAIARALVTGPDLLIADEAVSSLDVSVQAQILQLIRSLQQEHGIAFLFISHDLAVIRQIADEVAVMYRGQVLEHAPADVFFCGPAHPYSTELLALANYQTPTSHQSHPWRLGRGREAHDQTFTCVYADVCAKKMQVCEDKEPAYHIIQDMNGKHCVRCHLYDEA